MKIKKIIEMIDNTVRLGIQAELEEQDENGNGPNKQAYEHMRKDLIDIYSDAISTKSMPDTSDLKKGDFIMYCPKCLSQYKPNTAGPSFCTCGEKMRILKV